MTKKDIEVYLGGTVSGSKISNKSKWREEFIELLEVKYFNPLHPTNNKDNLSYTKFRDINAKKASTCDYYVYCITPADGTMLLAVADLINLSVEIPEKLILIIIDNDGSYSIDSGIEYQLDTIANKLSDKYIETFYSLFGAANYINSIAEGQLISHRTINTDHIDIKPAK